MRPLNAQTTEPRVSLRSVESGGLRHEINDILREAIWEGVLKPGQRLNEQKLSTEIGVSRPPLREAIRVLEQEGLVVSIPRRGTFVRDLSGRDIFEIYAVRFALEGIAAELCMEQTTPEALEDLERQIDRVESAEDGNLRTAIDQDLDFHRALVSMSGSERLASMWESIAGQLRLALTLVDPAFFEADYVEMTHRPLIAAIRSRDAGEVWRLTRSLLEVGRSLSAGWDEQVAEDGQIRGHLAATVDPTDRG